MNEMTRLLLGKCNMTKPVYTSQEMLEKLISFDTISHNSNMELINFVRDYLSAYGVESHLVTDDIEDKASLYAVYGDASQPGIAFSGHTDVVPTEGQDWATDPFEMVEKNGLLYGRGTCDMKGFIAVVLAKLPDMIAANMQTPIHFMFSYDEEVGCLGAFKLADYLKEQNDNIKLCIVGEPTMMKPITAHKGVCDTCCEVHGKECHSSLAPYGVNAVEYAAELVAHMKQMARRFKNEGPYDTSFDPPYTTLHTGVLSGGTALNIVPQYCSFDFEIRSIPSHDPEEIVAEIKEYAFKHLEPQMKDVEPKAGIEFDTNVNIPAFGIDDEDEIVSYVQGLTGSNTTEKVSFATEAGIFQAIGIPTIVCGPGSIEQAHKPNEFVSVEQIRQCESFIDRLIAKEKE